MARDVRNQFKALRFHKSAEWQAERLADNG
jgi:hypothetical protein